MPVSRIVKVEVSRRGPAGAIDPADRARIDAAINVAETITAVVQTATAAQAGAVAAAGQSSVAAEAAQQAAAQASGAAAEAAPAAAAAVQAALAADADRAETAATQSTAAATAAQQAATTAAADAAVAAAPAAADAIRAQVATDAAAAQVSAAAAAAALAGVNNDVVADRGDAQVWAMSGGVAVGAFDAAGRLMAVPAPLMIAETFAQIGDPEASSILTRLDASLDRGDSGVAYTMGGAPVLAFQPSGHADLRLSDDAIGDVAERLDLGNVSSAPLSADLIGDNDGWDVWQSGDLTFFTGNIWGPTPRGYVLRPGGEPWAVAPSAMRLRLAYGDHVANAAPDRAPDHFAHIATLADGAGQDGLDGVAATIPAADLARAGAGFAALSADRTLTDATGALRMHGVRSEAVEGATLAQLATGQPLANLVRARDEFARIAALYGGTAGVEAVTVLHSGGAATAGAYAADLVALASTIMAQTDANQVNVIPPAGTWQDGTDPAILGAPEALRTRGAVPLVLASQVHWCGVRAGTLATPDAASMTMLAELDALATAAGTGWHGPIPWQAIRSGATVTVDCEVMAGHALVAPTFGVRYSAAAITGMTIIADPVTGRMTRLQVTLASAVAGVLTIAYGATGADPAVYANRCDLRDDWSAPSITGGTLRRYSHAFRAEV